MLFKQLLRVLLTDLEEELLDSDADTQVLATRWDMRAEENGFPANRQFYIVENFKKIFYSADVNDNNVESAVLYAFTKSQCYRV